jgi:hypothetical protein
VSAEEHADENGKVRLELELVFRAQGDAAEATAIEALQNGGGELISRSRVAGAGYHANQVPNKRACWHGALPQGQSCSGDHDGEACRLSQRRSATKSVYRGQTHRRLGRSGSS